MILHNPFEISPRLLPGLRIGNAWIQLQYAKCSDPFRQGYRWTIDLPDGSEHAGNDLKSGCQGGGLQEGFASLLCFLSACGESVAYARRTGREGENADLFPVPVAEWAAQNSDELSMMQLDLDEAKQPLIEE